jgi:uncharacterized protein YndB with AHSA1/START domain
MNFGTFRTTNQRHEVVFERTLNSPADRVWGLVTSEEGLRRWLAPSQVDLRLGGSIEIDFGEGEAAGGEITDLVAGESIEFRWRFTDEPDSMVRVELTEIDATTTRLRLRHWMLPPDQAVGYGAGWHAHLDQLEAAINGSDPIDWMERFTELMPEYQTRTG